MKQTIILMALLSFGLLSCTSSKSGIQLNNTLTEAEKEAGILTPEVMWKLGRVSGEALSSDGEWLLYTLTRYSVKENRGYPVIIVRNTRTQERRELTTLSDRASAARFGANDRIYYMQDILGETQLFSMDLNGKKRIQHTAVEGGIEDYGVSPDAKHLFIIKSVHVKDFKGGDVYKEYPKSGARIYSDLMCRHWNVWEEGNYRHIMVGDLSKKVSSFEDIIGKDSAWDAPLAPYFDTAEITWSPDSESIAYTCKPLTGTEYALSTDSDIYIYSLNNRTTENICLSTNTLSLEGNTPEKKEFLGYDKYPVFSPSSKKVAFISQAEPGYESDKGRIYVYDRVSHKMECVTDNFDHSASQMVWTDENTIVFTSGIEATIQLCRVSVPDHKVEVITSGDHDINSFTLSNDICIASVATISSPATLYTLNLTTGEKTLFADENSEILSHLKMGKVEKRWVKTTDNKEMLTWVILPPDFSPEKKYPTLLYCQGGPQSIVSQFWSYRWNFQLMAAQGYIVVAPNRRGVPSFGSEWLRQISGDYSGQNIKDYLAAIDDVAKESWCDKDHLGCVGASYGGYSVYYLAGHHDNRFKAFISHCGIFNLESMYGETEELFFVNKEFGGSYWDKTNKTAVRTYENSPHKAVGNWNTPILIFTGENDFRIPYTQSLQAFTAARLRGVDARLVEFKDEAHQVFKPQNSLVWNKEFFGWLDKYLK